MLKGGGTLTAVLLVDCFELDELRRQHDKGFGKWPTHLTVAMECSSSFLKLKSLPMKPFTVRLGDLYSTPNSKYIMLNVLDDQHGHHLEKLLSLLLHQTAAVSSRPSGPADGVWRPHISIGQAPQPDIPRLLEEIRPQLPTDFSWEVDHVAVLQFKNGKNVLVHKITLEESC